MKFAIRLIYGKWFCVIYNQYNEPIEHWGPFAERKDAHDYGKSTGHPNKDHE